jgi:predicted hotdog family 3-hydroxylacyl-ACP dehydratase
VSVTATATDLHDCIGMPAATFVMHREPLLLLDTLVECDGDSTACEWTVQEGDAFVDPGKGVPAHVAVEHMAQCVAVHAGARAWVEGLGPPLGFLLGTRHFTAAIPYFVVGETYRATCMELIRDDSGMGSYECSVLRGEEVVAAARLSVLEKERGKPLR